MPGKLPPHVVTNADLAEREYLISKACSSDLRKILATGHLQTDVYALAKTELDRRAEERDDANFALAKQTAANTKLGIWLMATTLVVSLLGVILGAVALFK